MQITVNVPEQYLIDTSPGKFGERMKLSTAVLMFQSGEISAGAASELAGVDRFAFAAECARHGIAVVSYESGELEEEVSRVRARTR
jgi:predicted HTH domain antitoxin